MSEYKRLTERYIDEQGINCVRKLAWDGEILHRLVELEDKIENGTLRDFPCAVGDEVFWACDLDKQYSQVMHGVVIGLSISPKNTVWVSVKYDDGLSFDHTVESWGKSVFLTKAEAEARLKELDNSYKENR